MAFLSAVAYPPEIFPQSSDYCRYAAEQFLSNIYRKDWLADVLYMDYFGMRERENPNFLGMLDDNLI